MFIEIKRHIHYASKIRIHKFCRDVWNQQSFSILNLNWTDPGQLGEQKSAQKPLKTLPSIGTEPCFLSSPTPGGKNRWVCCFTWVVFMGRWRARIRWISSFLATKKNDWKSSTYSTSHRSSWRQFLTLKNWDDSQNWLVVSTHLKNMLVKLDHVPK